MKTIHFFILMLLLAACGQNDQEKTLAQDPKSQFSGNSYADNSYAPKKDFSEDSLDLPPNFLENTNTENTKDQAVAQNRAEQAPKLAQILSKYAPKTQKFEILAHKENWVIGEKGTKIFFPPHIFEKNPQGKIEIELQEYYDMDEFMLANLGTTSRTSILETGGTVFIKATCNGEELKIKKDHAYYLMFPHQQKEHKKGMQIFYGKYDAHQEMDWTPATTQNSQYLSYQPILEGIEYKIVDTTSVVYKYDAKVIATFLGQKMDTSQVLFNTLELKNDKKLSQMVKAAFGFAEDTLLVKYIDYVSFNLNVAGVCNKYHIAYKDAFFASQNKKEIHKIQKFALELKKILNLVELKERQNDKIAFKLGIEGSISNYVTQLVKKISKPILSSQELAQYSTQQVSDYAFGVMNFGWINCDRFTNDQRQKIQFAVRTQLKEQNVKLIFEETKSLLSVASKEGSAYFSGIPRGMKAKIVVVGIDQNGKQVMCVKPVTINQEGIYIDQFEDFDFSTLKKKIS